MFVYVCKARKISTVRAWTSTCSFQDIAGRGCTFPPELSPLQLLPFGFTTLPKLSMSKIRNMDAACNLSYTGTETAPGKGHTFPRGHHHHHSCFLSAVPTLHRSLRHTTGDLVLFNAPSRPRLKPDKHPINPNGLGQPHLPTPSAHGSRSFI